MLVVGVLHNLPLFVMDISSRSRALLLGGGGSSSTSSSKYKIINQQDKENPLK